MSDAEQRSRIRGVVFDKDGTLFDFNATWGAWAAEVIKTETKGDPENRSSLAQVLGFDLATGTFLETSIVIASPAADIARAAMPFLADTSVDVVLNRWNTLAAKAPQVEATPLQPFVERLKRAGLKLGVATNDAEYPARAHLKEAGVEEAFEFIAGSDSGFGSKPETGQLMAFCDATGLHPRECVMVGDSTHDLHAGRAAGMKTVAVLTGVAGKDELAPFSDVVLPSIAQLPDWLEL
ncbi:HAD family hydrolase [Octadecabacter sp.]|nr:HAD family hydrolase [Octadecabacter sp.]